MECVRRIISGEELNNIISLPLSFRNNLVEVIVLPSGNNDAMDKTKPKRQLGFAKGAEVPESFFEPLSEEELQAWGL